MSDLVYEKESEEEKTRSALNMTATEMHQRRVRRFIEVIKKYPNPLDDDARIKVAEEFASIVSE
jgi:hypothetical protein